MHSVLRWMCCMGFGLGLVTSVLAQSPDEFSCASFLDLSEVQLIQRFGGICLGMRLREIEQLNGWPFRLRGLEGPEGLGVIRSWGQGRLRDVREDGCMVWISLQPSGDRPVDPAMYRQVGRADFFSGHPAMQAINPRVASLTLAYDPRPIR